MAPRRTHRKSKRGCSECKRRHIKCDETRPICVNCTTSKRTCKWEFDVRAPATTQIEPTKAQSTPTDPQLPAGGGHLTPVVSAGSHTTGGSPLAIFSQGRADSIVNIDHLELLHHFYTDTCRTVVRTQDQIELYSKLVIAQGIANPFLMHEILAISAIHIGILRPHRREYYHSLATSLQSKALADFNEILSRIDATSCLPVLLFSHLIGLHTFHDIFNVLKDDFNTFMDGLVGCVRLLRGVNLVTQTWRDVLLQSELGDIMREADQAHCSEKTSHGECSPLRDLIDAADLSLSSKEVCREALEKLQEYFDVENGYPGELLATTNVIFAWFVTASSQYTELMDQRRPEALILLAYYAVLLHRRRKSWVVGDAGQRLLTSITTHLGRRWETWLAWPKNAITFGTSSNTPISAA
ncbi:uncharacterized protein Z520_10783 [Fonsecaea multimorphosa CBS 102226]|uniref:Zn(2)-C6 fungal-type domain-containing protein n=1 Tax=Fonsecaea multimorphosa CBS 102226 TaxID=1442371 RepID=A0A0D2GVH7_9EURO|nr:uncharacterized protein Z520_10783 [Fonsecaea multimorphosa CBS 102226]KIX93605.1 hypothetical protein Z520_10783 [Fonsecaea multimorphosa CBS 102226]